MSETFLIEPTQTYETSFYQMVNDYKNNGETEFPKYFNPSTDTFIDYLKRMTEFKEGINLKPGHVKTVTYWLVNQEQEILGVIRYREELTAQTFIDGGNIGYDVPPSKRNNGYATIMVQKLLEILKEKGKEKVLVTCEHDNVPSIHVVLKNNGAFEDEKISPSSGQNIKRYWIYLKKDV